MASVPSIAEVAVRAAVDKSFHYAIPERLAPLLRIGQRVLVPFGTKTLHGTVISFPETSDFKKLKEILSIQDPEPLCSPHLLALTKWVAEYYACAWSEALEAAVPAGAKHGHAASTLLIAALGVPPDEARAAALGLRAKAPRQSRMLEILLGEASGELPAADLARSAKASRAPLEALARAGLVRLRKEEVLDDPLLTGEVPLQQPLVPTAEQTAALEAIAACNGFGAFLLHGVTGSGKTEVYLQAISRVVEKGKQAIVLVPEIALTPQTVGRFRARFREVAVLHSRLTQAQRRAQWERIRAGKARVVVGARSAVFAPASDLGLIVVDEEPESSFKQQSKPRYHARAVAVQRARMLGIPVLLGSATPSLECWEATRSGRMRLLTLTARQGGGALPPVLVVDMRQELREIHKLSHLSRPLLRAMAAALEKGEQAMLLLNRRGFATAVSCRRCGWALGCAHCDVTLTWHKREGRARCHLCDHGADTPEACPDCGLAGLRYLGFGTEKVEEELAKALPKARIARMDADTTRGRLSHQEVLGRFEAGGADILLGTQMIAKGLDIPNVTVVGVVSADTGLHLPDFRAAERTFQLLAQVSGRAGRGPKGGRVIVQTFNPSHPAVKAAAEHDYEGFAKVEMGHRKALGYPPFARLARIVVQGREVAIAESKARGIGEALRAVPAKGAEILGPAPCPIARVESWHRFHLLVKAPSDEVRRRILAAIPLKLGSASLRVSVDVDPTDLL